MGITLKEFVPCLVWIQERLPENDFFGNVQTIKSKKKSFAVLIFSFVSCLLTEYRKINFPILVGDYANSKVKEGIYVDCKGTSVVIDWK